MNQESTKFYNNIKDLVGTAVSLWVSVVTVLWVGLGFTNTSALAGKNDDPIQSICVLYYSTPTGKVAQCGGVLLESQVMLTSGQCFAEGLDNIVGSVKVGCGHGTVIWGDQLQFRETFNVNGVQLYSDGIVTNGAEAGSDYALVRLDHPARSAEPMLLPQDLSEFQEEFLEVNPHSSNIPGNDYHLRPGIECRQSWFRGEVGTDEFSLATEDYSTGWEKSMGGLKSHLSTHLYDNPALVLEFWGEKRNMASSLATGAALYCREHGGAPWKLLGISSAVQAVGGSSGEVSYEFLASTLSPQFYSHWRKTLYNWGLLYR